jgi:hypothetical protein
MIRAGYLFLALIFTVVAVDGQIWCSSFSTTSNWPLANKQSVVSIVVDEREPATVLKAASLLQEDIQKVTGQTATIIHSISGSKNNLVIIGSAGHSAILDQLVQANAINLSKIIDHWEAYQVQSVRLSGNSQQHALVIAGSDRRGTAYGVFSLSAQLGVSPWYWWADVPVKKQFALFVKNDLLVIDSPRVKYRGIFINDEAPALSGWTREKNGGFNSKLYTKVFELILRLKGNYIWPAMWGNAFYDDDSLNIRAADEYGIVIGTSHHEPLMRAHDEWRRYGKGKWNYDSNAVRLQQFWKEGMQRATNEKIVTVGMRGDGDEPMTRETATALLERIVKDQRSIIEQVTGKPAAATPQLWALYKEVQDYYDKGMRVPDDVTLLLCDDNWGNIRRLPKPGDKPRAGGYGIYYHFDYVGDPRNYKWLNTNSIPRVWEQMHLAWKHQVNNIWIVNVGDIKPMEYPISFFLDYAWNPKAIDADQLGIWSTEWCARQFGSTHAKEIAAIMQQYTKFNSRRKPELLNENTYSLDAYNEASRITGNWVLLANQAKRMEELIPPDTRDAYYELVLHPVLACANLQQMYYAVALNHAYAKQNNPAANIMADSAKWFYAQDSVLTARYHSINNGKWNHMMSQTHIGYTYWQQPEKQKMPALQYVQGGADAPKTISASATAAPANRFQAIESDHYKKLTNRSGLSWKRIPDIGRTGAGMTLFPVTAAKCATVENAPELMYQLQVPATGEVTLYAYFSPTLNLYHNEGMQYAVAIDHEEPQMITVNKDDAQPRIWGKWVADNIIVTSSKHQALAAGSHTIHFKMLQPALVLQKLVVDGGDLKESYLGPPTNNASLKE